MFLIQAYFYTFSTGQEMDWSRQAPYRLSGYLAWGLLTLPLYKLFLWLRSSMRMHLHVILQVVLALVIGSIHRLAGTLIEYLFRLAALGEQSTISAFYQARKIALVGGTLDSAVTYLILILAFYLITQVTQNREQQRKIERVQNQLLKSRLDTLQSKLQPHFLFNTLNGIAAAVHAYPMKAEAMINQLARILRFSLDHSEHKTVKLIEEVNVIQDYLKIEQSRLGERLKFSIDISEACFDFKVPPMILQPIVENAVKHGVLPFNKPGIVELSVTDLDGIMRINVSDSGLPTTSPSEVGLGLKNCRARLYVLYGDKASIEMSESELGGTKMTLLIPDTESEPKSEA